MSQSAPNVVKENIHYSKVLSSLFCSVSIMTLSILCLLNNLTLDLYSICMLIKVVAPGAFCFWFIGYVMGHVFDNHHGEKKQKTVKLTEDNGAYEIPSMFATSNTVESESNPEEDNENIEL